MDDLKLLINSRKFIRKQITETYNARSGFGSIDAFEKSTLKTKLNDHAVRLKELDAKIQQRKWSESEDETELENELAACENYYDKIRTCLSALQESLVSQSQNTSSNLLKSPTAPLPLFTSKENEDLTKFFYQFEEVVNKYNYSDYEKLLLLKQQVRGRALILINSLESYNQGYTHAKELLEKALASPIIQKFNTLKQLSELKLDECEDPFEYISKLKSIQENVTKLKLSVDDILQYFSWKGLNDSFQKILVSISNKTWPSFEEIIKHFFTACERYNHKSLKKKAEKSTDLAVKVAVSNRGATAANFFPCCLCSTAKVKADHSIKWCNKFRTPKSKVDQLKNLNGCTRCGFVNHTTARCSYRFKESCSTCGGYHWNYLCVANSKKIEVKKADDAIHDLHSKKKSPKTRDDAKVHTQEKLDDSKSDASGSHNNISTITEAQRSNNNEGETILPTFTCRIGSEVVRGMKDGGCQSNFITTALADKLNLQVVDSDVKLTVNGINSSKVYQTKAVQMEIKFGDKTHFIKALCMPSINICLKLPNLRIVVNGFREKGFCMADEMLLDNEDEISEINLIIGSKSSFCIPEEEIVFGKENQSVYSKTNTGIILKGDISTLLEDLPYLSYSSDLPLHCLPAVVGRAIQPKDCMKTDFCLKSNLILNTSQDKNFNVLDGDGKIDEQQLLGAAREILESVCENVLQKDVKTYSEEELEVNNHLIDFVFKKTWRNDQGRLKMPILWNPRVSHLLGKNYVLAKNILMNTLKKLKGKDEDSLAKIDKVFKEQQEMGIIKRIDNLDQFIEENPVHSFLPFMAIFKPERETTKCRVVFLSNLSEKNSMSHNQCIHAGPSLNQKLLSSILHLRFGQKICCFDIRRAFNQIELEEIDQNRLLFLWFKNVSKEDYSLVAYKNVRLPFGLRCSPTILMLGMFKLLVLDSKNDNVALKYMKSLIYQLSYMDNCAISAESSEDLNWMYDRLESTFSPYQFQLQQFMSNDLLLQSKIDESNTETTPTVNKFLGLQWDRVQDKLFTKSIKLDGTADTKRKILSSIASQFDLLNFNGPLINRARIFMHQLQCQQNLDWDEKLSSTQLREWTNITKQVNSSPPVKIDRCFGARNDPYKLVAYADSSKLIYGIVVYMLNLRTEKLTFVLARNRLVNRQLETKTIPSLELLAIALAAETLNDLKEELSGTSCINPINIEGCEVFSDSLVALNWLNSYALKLDKLQRKHNFVLNRLEDINKVCEKFPIKFSFVSGESNPADCITRTMSFKLLVRSNYFSGPDKHCRSAEEKSAQDIMSFVVPGPSMESTVCETVQMLASASSAPLDLEHLTSIGRATSFSGVGRVLSLVLKFIDKLKLKLKKRDPGRYDHLVVQDENFNFFSEACNQIIFTDQKFYFPEVFSYFSLKEKTLKNLPNIVSQLNLYLDSRGLIRVKSKCEKIKNIKKYGRYNFPLLISKQSPLASLIIRDCHEKLSHGGCYSVLAEIRKQFWIPHIYSMVKRQISDCITCKKMNARPIKINQSPYREMRLDPLNIPFGQIFMDYMGPFTVKDSQNKNVKVWILCITCMWSRAINLKLCHDLTTDGFLRAFQLHCYEYGVPSHCISDLGSQLVAGSSCIASFLNDYESSLYFQENNISPIKFEQYFKGCSKLGSLVESCVKLTKRLLHGAIKNNIINIRDFEFIVCKTRHLVNRRPIAFKESLRDTSGEAVPDIVTPEMLIHGRELMSINVIPHLQSSPDPDPDWSNNIPLTFEKLQKVRNNLIKLYNEEFIGKLIYQAVNEKGRYKPVCHQKVSVGDVILLKEPNSKPHNYPLARIREIVLNTNGEVTGIVAIKGKTREVVKRHASTIIPLLSTVCDEDVNVETDGTENSSMDDVIKDLPTSSKTRRKAAIDSEFKTRQILSE